MCVILNPITTRVRWVWLARLYFWLVHIYLWFSTVRGLQQWLSTSYRTNYCQLLHNPSLKIKASISGAINPHVDFVLFLGNVPLSGVEGVTISQLPPPGM